MQKITLVAHKKDRRKILKILAGLGVVEVVRTGETDNTSAAYDYKNKEIIDKKLARLNFAFAFLKDIKRDLKNKDLSAAVGNTEALDKLTLGRENKLLSYDELTEIVKEEYELFNLIERLEETNGELVDIKSEKSRLTNLQQQISVYSGLDIKFSEIKDTKRVTVTAGTVPQDNLQILEENIPSSAVLNTAQREGVFLVVAAAPLSDKEELIKALALADFSKCPFDFDTMPDEMLSDIGKKVSALDEKRAELYKSALACYSKTSEFKLLYDYYLLENAKIDLMAEGRETAKAFIMDGWVPAAQAEATVKAVKDACPSAECMLRDPQEGETVPSFVRNNKVVGSFGDIVTSTFGFPKYGELDPNPFVAFFYFLFFGFMLSDAGYGLIIALFCFSYLLIKKPAKNSGSFMIMFGLCGVSTVIWGTIFGGWFGLEAETLAATSIGRFLLSLKLLDPLNGNQTLIMFVAALGMGIVQISVGFTLSAVSKLKTAPLEGILNDFSWVIIFIGGGIYALDMALKTGVVNIIGMVIALIGVAMLLVGGAWGKRNPIKMIMGAFKNLYGSINVFSDVLSYARLFGLGLTTGVIGLVVNRIGSIFIDMIPYYIGYLFAVPIWIGGHIFNLGINALGVYVHNSRLQYVEFFGKFYTGEGHAFKPFGSGTKYIFLKDNLSNKPNK